MTDAEMKIYTEKCIDEISFRLHSNEGYEVDFTVWEDSDGEYHVYAEPDTQTCDFLSENYPDEHDTYLKAVEKIPTERSRYLDIINQFIARQTYNSVRPITVDDNGWLALDEAECDKD